MAYDQTLAERIRALLTVEPDLAETRMFGGLAFLIGGKMAVAASGRGGLLVRVDPAEHEVLIAATNARPMEMRGRELKGWLRVEGDDIANAGELSRWVALGTTYARSLQAKRADDS